VGYAPFRGLPPALTTLAKIVTTTQPAIVAAEPGQPETSRYDVTLAADAIDVRSAQRLRFDVFSTECGAVTPGPEGLDVDRFDDLCDHLVVREATPAGHGRTVATYRLLPPHAHDKQPPSHSLYAHTEFDLSTWSRCWTAP